MKFMNKKRIASAALAGVLALSMATPAFASGAAATAEENTTTITSTLKKVPVDVVVPTTSKAFINPYGLDLKVEGSNTNPATADATIKGQQIVTAPMWIQNKSAMDLAVSATVTTTVDGTKSNMMLSSESAADASTKSAYVYLQAKQAVDTTATAATLAAECAAWAKSAYDENHDVLLSTTLAATSEDLVTLRAATMNASGAFASYNAGSIALVRLTGDCAVAPVTGEWAETDGFVAKVAFTFKPANIAKYTITEGTHTAASGTIPSVAITPSNPAAGDTVTVNVTGIALADTVIAVTATPADNTISPITVTMGAITSNASTGTFVMPASDVTVTVAVSAS